MIQKTLLLLSTLFMAFVGFVPIGSSQLKPAEWVDGVVPGLLFQGQSLVYTERFPGTDGNSDELSISLLISPEFLSEPEFGAILSIFDEVENTRVTIGQWDRSLMVLEGTDFSNSRREPKMYIPIPSEETLQIHITSNRLGTSVYFDGTRVGFNPELILPLPLNPDQSHLTVGNSVFAWDAWSGTIHSLDIYDETVHPGNEDSGSRPILEYLFDESGGSLVRDLGGSSTDLLIARKRINLDRHFLRIPDADSLHRDGMQRDILINFFGFMPFGFLVYLVGRKRYGNRRLPGLLVVLVCSFLFSLGIESIQILLPARDSSLLDLVLNTLGGTGGGIAAILISKRARV